MTSQMFEQNLQGAVAVVTGGGRGIGMGICLALASYGAKVAVNGLTAQELETTCEEIGRSGGEALPVIADVAQEIDVIAMRDRTLEVYGIADILINNAAIIGPTASVPDIAFGEWNEVIAVNLTGAFLCCKHFLPGMIERRGGKIINIASIAGKMAYPLRSPYAVSKWGMIGLTRTLAVECGPFNIQVNAVCPGPVQGDRMDSIIKVRASETGQSVDEVEKFYQDKTALKRMVSEKDVISMVLFLASEAANNITGEAFNVAAGWGL